jgi:lipoate-protein ligase A
MRLILNNGQTDPAINLALEEYCVRNLDMTEPYLLLYVNDPAVIIGKHQNALAEINQPFINENNIPVYRRISGGGAVFHDHGNLNYSFLNRFEPGQMLEFTALTRPILKALQEAGVPAKLNERNDIVADDRKISGTAQFTTVRSMFSHGTLLFDSDLSRLRKALDSRPYDAHSRGVRSIRSSVANIREFLTAPPTLEQFRADLARSILGDARPLPTFELSELQWSEVRDLAENVYRTWDWNYGKSPRFSIPR